MAETSKSRKWRSMFFVLAETSDSQVNVYAFKHRHRGDGVPEACMRLLDAHIDVLQVRARAAAGCPARSTCRSLNAPHACRT